MSPASQQTLDHALDAVRARGRVRWQEAFAALHADALRVLRGGPADVAASGLLEAALQNAREQYEVACDSSLRQLKR